MKSTYLILLLLSAVLLAAAEKETKDIDVDDEDYGDELERGHRKRRRKQQQQAAAGPCGALGFGRTLGWGGGPSSTYVSAPVQNYYIGCGGAQPQQQPFLPVAPLPPFQPYPGGFGGHHQHNHHHNHGGHGGHHGGGFNGYPQPQFNYQNQGFNQQPFYDQYQPYSQGYQRPQRPGIVSAAASGLGTALADYISGGNRPKKTYKQVTKTVNQLFKPLYNLF